MNLKQLLTTGAIAVGGMLYTGCSTTQDYHGLSNMPAKFNARALKEYENPAKASRLPEEVDAPFATFDGKHKEATKQIATAINGKVFYSNLGRDIADKLNLQTGEYVSVVVPSANTHAVGTYNPRNTNLNTALGHMKDQIMVGTSKSEPDISTSIYKINDDENGLTSIISIVYGAPNVDGGFMGYDLKGEKVRSLKGLRETFKGRYTLTPSANHSTLDIKERDKAILAELSIDALGGLGALPSGPFITTAIGGAEKGIEHLVNKDTTYQLREGNGFLYTPDKENIYAAVLDHLNSAREVVSEDSTPEASHYMLLQGEKNFQVLVANQNDDRKGTGSPRDVMWSLDEKGNPTLLLKNSGDLIDFIPAAIILKTTRTRGSGNSSPSHGGGLGTGGPQTPINGGF